MDSVEAKTICKEQREKLREERRKFFAEAAKKHGIRTVSEVSVIPGVDVIPIKEGDGFILNGMPFRVTSWDGKKLRAKKVPV